SKLLRRREACSGHRFFQFRTRCNLSLGRRNACLTPDHGVGKILRVCLCRKDKTQQRNRQPTCARDHAHLDLSPSPQNIAKGNLYNTNEGVAPPGRQGFWNMSVCSDIGSCRWATVRKKKLLSRRQVSMPL